MNDKSMSFSVNKDLDVHSKSFDAFISYMENSNDFWLIYLCSLKLLDFRPNEVQGIRHENIHYR